MQTAALNDVSSQGQQLRYLTAHFRDLQGLRMAPLWLELLVLTSLAKTGSFSRGHLAWAAAASIAAQFASLHLVGLWYERRYGIVKEPEPAVPSGLISIMHPEAISQRSAHPVARRYGYLSGVSAVLCLLWAFSFVPYLFFGHRPQPGMFALQVAPLQFFARCICPVTDNWSVLLRRILAYTAMIAMIGIYLDYRFGLMDLLTWMALMFSFLLLLDLYDHWLLSHLLSSDFAERYHE